MFSGRVHNTRSGAFNVNQKKKMKKKHAHSVSSCIRTIIHHIFTCTLELRAWILNRIKWKIKKYIYIVVVVVSFISFSLSLFLSVICGRENRETLYVLATLARARAASAIKFNDIRPRDLKHATISVGFTTRCSCYIIIIIIITLHF